MKRRRFSETQVAAILKEVESGRPVTEICREHGISNATYYQWKSKYSVQIDLVEKEIDESLQPQQQNEFDWNPANDPTYRELLSEAFLRIPIDYLEVSTRLLKSLQNSDFKTVRDIASVSETEFRRRTGLSDAGFQEMKDLLLKHFTDFATSEIQGS